MIFFVIVLCSICAEYSRAPDVNAEEANVSNQAKFKSNSNQPILIPYTTALFLTISSTILTLYLLFHSLCLYMLHICKMSVYPTEFYYLPGLIGVTFANVCYMQLHGV